MIPNNTMRLGMSPFSFQPRGMVTARVPIDLLGQTNIKGFQIEGVEPAGSIRKAIFKVGDSYQYFPNITETGEAVPVNFPYDATIDNILDFGTKLSDLAQITSISNWENAQVYPIVALQATSSDIAQIPAAKIGVKVVANTDQLSKTEETAEYEFATSVGSKASIIDVIAKTTVTGSASISITAMLKNEDEWSAEYQLSELKNLEADAIKFKITYTVSALDTETAKVDQIQIRYTSGESGAVAGSEAEIVSIEQNYENGLRFAQATVRHSKLIDGNISAFVSFRAKPLSRQLLEIGVGTGEVYTYNLKPSGQAENDKNLDQTSLRIFVDGVEKIGFNFNSGTSQVTLTAPQNSVVTASYNYQIEQEEWRQMDLILQEPYKQSGWYSSRFEYAMPDEEEEKPIASVKFILERPVGDVVNQNLGTATGLTQTFVLPHRAKVETIKIPNASFSYDESSQMLRVVANKGTELQLSYSWCAESQEIDGFTIGFAAVAYTAS